MSNSDRLKMTGVVVDVLKGGKFLVKLDDNGLEVTCTIAGKMRSNYITVLRNDKVDIDMSPYDLTQGRIIFRYK